MDFQHELFPFGTTYPQVGQGVWIAPGAKVIGDVVLGEDANVWFQSVIRGDVNWIRIGARTNIQDLTMVHVTKKEAPCEIGDDVTVGHRVILHGCKVGNRVLIGMGSILLDKCEIPEDSMVAAGSLVPPGKTYRSGTLIMGSPAKEVRDLTDKERAFLLDSAAQYVGTARSYRSTRPTRS